MSECISILETALAYYNNSKDEHKDKVFTLLVVAGFRCLKLDDIAERVKEDPSLAYQLAKKITTDYSSLGSNITVVMNLRKLLAETYAK